MIASIIQFLVSQLNSNGILFDFKLGPSWWANLQSDEVDFGEFQGIIYLDQPIETEYQLTAGGYIGEYYDVNIFFMLKSELDWTPIQHETDCVIPAHYAIRQFLSICQSRTDLIDSISDATAHDFHNLLDVNVSGKVLSLKIKASVNAGVCIPNIPTP